MCSPQRKELWRTPFVYGKLCVRNRDNNHAISEYRQRYGCNCLKIIFLF